MGQFGPASSWKTRHVEIGVRQRMSFLRRPGVQKLEPRLLLAADVYISEFVASNQSGLRDADGDFPDWIELYNSGPDDADLAGWHLTDDRLDLTKWTFPEVSLPAGEFLVVFASDKNRLDPANELHLNFRLTSEGEYLGLVSEAGDEELTVVSEFAPAFPMQFEDVSYGVTQSSNGGDLVSGSRRFFDRPTPGERNPSVGDVEYQPPGIEFSHVRGFYEDEFRLQLSSSLATATIRYTLDGSEPISSRGSRYRSPIRINTTTTVRARAFGANGHESDLETATYLFLDDIVRQSPTGRAPSGFPTSRSINGQQLDYGMDPDIVSDAEWGPQLRSALTDLPSLSLVMDVDDLLGSRDGIYVNARERGRDWERPGSLELINPDGTTGFQVGTGVRIRGGFSRSDSNPKHAFRLFFRDEYGDAKLRFPLFGEEGTDAYDKLDLRTAQNYSWSFRGSGDNTFLRDVLARDLQGDLGQPYTRSRFYHLYLNGQYWGLFQSQERAEARYAASYFGGDKDDYDVIKSTGNDDGYQNEATDGNMDAYRRLADMFYQIGGLSDRNLDDYFRAQGMNEDGTPNADFERLLDVDNLIDYMLLTYYTGDRDGPVSRFVNGVNNYFAIYNRESPDGFKFFEHDSEHTLDKGFPDLAERITSNGSNFRHFNPLWMHEQLVASNADYRLRFTDAVLRHFSPDEALSEENVRRLFDARVGEVENAIVAESARWGDAQRSEPLTKDDWESAVARARGFIAGRGEVLIEQFRNLGWMAAAGPPTVLVNNVEQAGGPVSVRDELTLRADGAIAFERSFVSDQATWRYLDDGSDAGTEWRASEFDDSDWQTGRAELGYGDNDESTRIDFGRDANNKHITSYFRHSFRIGDPDDFDGFLLRLLRDDGAVVYLNGEEIIRSNMPAGPIVASTLAGGTAGGATESTFFQHRLDSKLFQPGENVLAVEVHQVSPDSSDVSFNLELLGGRASTTNADLYYTLDGSDPRLPGGDVSPDAVRFRRGFSLALSGPVKARSLSGDRWGAMVEAHFVVTDPALTPADDALVVNEGGTATQLEGGAASVLDNDVGLQDGPITVSISRRPQHSRRFELNRDGTFLYEHDGSETNVDEFVYRVRDAGGQSETATVRIQILPVSDTTPQAVDDVVRVNEGQFANRLQSGRLSVLDNDTGLEDEPVVISLAREPLFASSFLLRDDGRFEYRHDGSENHADSFAYQLEDNDGEVVVGEVMINVIPTSDARPNPRRDSIVVDEGGTVASLASGDSSVLDNDAGVVDVPLVVSLLRAPESASEFVLNEDGTFSYTHDDGDSREDSFLYRVVDNDGDLAVGEVTITIRPVDESEPVAVADSVVVLEGRTVTELADGSESVLDNDESLLDGPNTVRVVRRPEFSSSFSLDRDGTFRYRHDGSENFADSFTYEVEDDDGDTSIGEVSITVLPVSDATPRAIGDTVQLAQGESTDRLSGGRMSVLDNDRGLADGPFFVSLLAAPEHATDFELNEDGTFTYQHNGARVEEDRFSYRVTDNDGQTADGVVRIEIALSVRGDLNGDGDVDVLDVELLRLAVRDAGDDRRLDLDEDGTISELDLDVLVEGILDTRRGDANLDGLVEFGDFLALAGAFGKTEAVWSDGDFNNDLVVDFDDFLSLAASFGYQRTRR